MRLLFSSTVHLSATTLLQRAKAWANTTGKKKSQQGRQKRESQNSKEHQGLQHLVPHVSLG